MEFAIYSVLILALASLAGFMLHARFSARRDKALHHAPLSLAAEGVAISGSEEEVLDVVAETVETEDPAPNELPAVKADAIPVESKEDERKSEYLDELQEAAAGLAMLMRSSAGSRPTPVVFAPDGEEVDSGVTVKDDVASPEGEIEAEDESLVESAATVVADDQAEEVAEPDKKTLEMLLGTEVTSQFRLIDSGLDDLEELVGSIESGLALLAPVEGVSDLDGPADAESELIEISEAA